MKSRTIMKTHKTVPALALAPASGGSNMNFNELQPRADARTVRG